MGRSRSRSRSRERHSKKSKSKSRRRSRTRSRDRSRDRRSRSQERYRRSPTPDDKSHSPVKQKEHALDLLERISAGSKKSLDELLLSGDAVVTTTRGDNSKLSLYEQYNVQKINVITIHSKGSKIRSRTEVDEGQGAGEFLSIFINKIIHDINRTQKLPKLGIFHRREIREFVEPTVETKISLRLPSKDELEKLEEKFVSRSKKDKDKGSSSASRSHLDSDRSSKSRDRSASRDGRQNESRDDWRDARLDIGRDDKRDDRREERGVGRVDRDDRNRAQKTVFKVSGIFRDSSMKSDDKHRRSVQQRLGGNQPADPLVTSTSSVTDYKHKTSNLSQRLGWFNAPSKSHDGPGKSHDDRSKLSRIGREEKKLYDPSIPEFRRHEHDDRDTWRSWNAFTYRNRPDGPKITDQRFKIPKISQIKPRKKEPETWQHDKFEEEEPSSTTS